MGTEIDFTLTEQDYVDAARSQYWSRMKRPQQWLSLLGIMLLVISFVAFLESWDRYYFLYGALPYVGIFAGTWLICTIGSYFWAGRWARRIYRQQKLQPETHMNWDDEGLRIQSALGTLQAKWTEFYCWKHIGSMHMLHINEALYYIVPQRALTLDQVAELESALVHNRVIRC
jgi:hypothetical protein